MSAPILPTVELPDRIHSWSYDIGRNEALDSGMGAYVFYFCWYVDDTRHDYSVIVPNDDGIARAFKMGWQPFWDNMFAKSIARADEVKS